MTGFARASGSADWGSWVWEAKSVNGRGLDSRVSTPSALDGVDHAIKAGISQRFVRGSLQISLRIEMADGGAEMSVNEGALKVLMEAYERADGALATGAALATLMSFKGVVDVGAASVRSLADNADAIAALIKSGEEVLDQLKETRLEEGRKLDILLSGHLSDIARITADAVAFAADQVTYVQAIFRKRMTELDHDGHVSEDRIASEIAVLATKADVTEELDRLLAHIKTGHDLLKSGDAVGRNLGFLAQELNREANTLCSKSATLDLTNAGLALKSVIDQFKEQAANVE